MKRTIIFILSILFIFTACTKEAEVPTCTRQSTEVQPTEAPTLPPPELTGDENSFSLSYLPDIGTYEPEKAPARWYPDYVGELIPSDEYGELIPYLGYENRFVGDGYYSDSVYYGRYYGLCTTDGVIVTDPVYSHIMQGEDGSYILIGVPKMGTNDEAVYPYYVAKSDGSTLVKLSDGAVGGGYVANGLYYILQEQYDISIYDREGNLVRGPQSEEFGDYYAPRAYADGVIVQEHHMKAYFVNSDLERISDVYQEIWPCGNGCYRVRALGTLEYGLVDSEGDFLLPLEYEQIYGCDAGYLVAKGGTFALLDANLNESFSVKYEGELFLANQEGPSLITLRLVGGEPDSVYTLSGDRLTWESASYIERKEMYFLTTNSETVITDADLNEIVRFPQVYEYRYSDVEDRYFPMSVQKVLSDGTTEFDLYDLVLYDMETGIMIDGVYEANKDHYIKRTDEGELVYYSYDGEMIEPPEDAVYENRPTEYRAQTPYGEIRMYIKGDYAYTEDAEGNIIVKRRAVFD